MSFFSPCHLSISTTTHTHNQCCLTAIPNILHPNTLHFIPHSDTLQSAGNNTLQCHTSDNISILVDSRGSEPITFTLFFKQALLKCPWATSSCSTRRYKTVVLPGSWSVEECGEGHGRREHVFCWLCGWRAETHDAPQPLVSECMRF